jgi:hypothetical protein
MNTRDSMSPPADIGEPTDEELLRTAYGRLHKRAFGVAIGVAAALVVFLVTAIQMIRGPDPTIQLQLLSEYFRGYSVSWKGALIGAFWAGFVGFVAGWFFAFCRNAAIAIYLFVVRAKAELSASQDILDHL